jgi:hypothetical protein
MQASENCQREWLLARLKRAILHMKLSTADLISVGVALKGGWITIAQAEAWLADDLGAWPLIEAAGPPNE